MLEDVTGHAPAGQIQPSLSLNEEKKNSPHCIRINAGQKNASWGTQQTSQIPAALLSQSKINQNPKPQVKSVVKYLALSPNRQSTRYISGPAHLNLSCCLWMPQGGRRSSCQAQNWELYICRSRAAHLHGTKADDNTKQPIDVHLWCVNSWANRPSEPLTILQPQSCGFISAFERGMLLRLGEGTVLRSRDDRRPRETARIRSHAL